MILECCAKRDACDPPTDPLVTGFICLSELAGIGECGVQDLMRGSVSYLLRDICYERRTLRANTP